MTREEFSTLSKCHILYLDGATGSNLVKAGMPSGVCPEQWILEHRDVMLKLQKDYVQAGTNILYAPTFTANRIKLSEYHLEKNMSAMIHELVAISREAATSSPGHTVLVAGDLTMTGEQLKPMGKMELEDLIDIYKEQILSMVDVGVDLLVVETMMSLAETRAALIAAKEVCDLPVIATLTFEADGRTLFGTDAKTAAIVLESLGASAIGANCSTGPAQMERRKECIPVLDTQGRPIVLGNNYVMSKITVSKDGSLCYPDAQNNPQPIGITIGVFQFNNPNGLERLADSLYQQTAASGQAINEATNNNVERSSIIQGYLESSNVQVVDEMVNMIVAQRAYELNSKAITASDEMLQQANNLRR